MEVSLSLPLPLPHPTRSLCLIALVGILSDFFLQIIFFLTNLSVDIRRMEVSLSLPLPLPHPPHSLCLIALVGILSDFFLQMIFFLTTLSVDIRRMEVSLSPSHFLSLPFPTLSLFDSSSGDIVRLLPTDDFLLDNPVCGYQKNGSKSLSLPLSLPPLPHSLCLIALVGILSDFFLQMIFFLTTLSVDIRRMEVSLSFIGLDKFNF